ncbi:MAG: tetratricopeptide repeat protein, partial [Candidatus Acidiferrales bacterium]
MRKRTGWHRNSGGSLLGFLFCLTLSLLLVSVCLSAQPIQTDRAEAIRHARELVEAQHYDAALEIFGRLAAQNPRDLEARNWMARLESWKGNHAQAEQLYRSVLADAPGDLEAELGLADVLGWQGRYSEALERLLDLRTRQPADAEVLLRLGRISRWQHKRRRALRYYREVLALDPGNAEAREGIDVLTAQKPFRLETGYFTEEFDFTGNTHGQRVSLLYQDHHRLMLLAAFQYQNKF